MKTKILAVLMVLVMMASALTVAIGDPLATSSNEQYLRGGGFWKS